MEVNKYQRARVGCGSRERHFKSLWIKIFINYKFQLKIFRARYSSADVNNSYIQLFEIFTTVLTAADRYNIAPAREISGKFWAQEIVVRIPINQV